jgi:hypothetical protein
VLLTKLLKRLSTNDARDISQYGFILAKLAVNLSDNDTVENFHSLILNNFLNSDTKRGLYASEFLATIAKRRLIKDAQSTSNITIEIFDKYEELIDELTAYHYISTIIYGYKDGTNIDDTRDIIADSNFIEERLMISRRLRNLGEFLKLFLYLYDSSDLLLSYQILSNISFDLTQNSQFHGKIQIIDTIKTILKTENRLKEGEKCDRNILDTLRNMRCSSAIVSVLCYDAVDDLLEVSFTQHILSFINTLMQPTAEVNVAENNKIAKILSPHIFNALTETTYTCSLEAYQNRASNLSQDEAHNFVETLCRMRDFLDKYYNLESKHKTSEKAQVYQLQQVVACFDVVGRVNNLDILRHFSQHIKAICEIDSEDMFTRFLNISFPHIFNFVKWMLNSDRELGMELLTSYLERFKKITNIEQQKTFFRKILHEHSLLFEAPKAQELESQIKEHLELLSIGKFTETQNSKPSTSTQTSKVPEKSMSKRANPKKEKRKIFR